MAGMYGTIKPADIDIDNDVEILFIEEHSIPIILQITPCF